MLDSIEPTIYCVEATMLRTNITEESFSMVEDMRNLNISLNFEKKCLFVVVYLIAFKNCVYHV